ncbi:MAG: cupin domain-containing protein [Promethearchaeota archaeon]
MNANYYINNLNLEKHPEGGYYKEIYRSDEIVSFNDRKRNLGTSIYYLLESKDVSHFHRLKSDEIFHFHDGSSLIIYIIDSNGELTKHSLGLDVEKGEYPQIIIPKGSIFGAEVIKDNSFTLVGCIVFPGFNFEDFELLDRKYLLKNYPKYKEIIIKLTR